MPRFENFGRNPNERSVSRFPPGIFGNIRGSTISVGIFRRNFAVFFALIREIGKGVKIGKSHSYWLQICISSQPECSFLQCRNPPESKIMRTGTLRFEKLNSSAFYLVQLLPDHNYKANVVFWWSIVLVANSKKIYLFLRNHLKKEVSKLRKDIN